MALRYRLTALLLLLVWVPYFAHCAEPHCPALHPSEHCCQDHQDTPEHEESGDACHQHDPAAASVFAGKLLPAAAFATIAEWLLSALTEPPAVAANPVAVEVSGGPAPPLACVLVRTALPVRGPSI